MIKKNTLKTLSIAFSVFVISTILLVPFVNAASTPNLGQTSSFGILSSTYTNTVGGTTINGDLGYTTGPASAPTVNGTIYSPPSSKYSTVGTDQTAALASLAAQPCTHTFPAGAVDLATDTSHGTIGVYTPGVYCTTASSAASIGAGGITLSGSGTYIFRIDGALTTVANSVVTIAGASSCDVFWTPTGATTLGANSTFVGTDIDAAGITIGSTVNWTGRALSFGGTVSTTTDTINVPSCNTLSTSSNTNHNESKAAPDACVTTEIKGTPQIIESRRMSPTSIYLSWGPYEGANTFVVEYGVENGKWLYNTTVTGFNTTINSLPANQNIWARVVPTDNCAVGHYSTAKLIGSPGLPNAGFGPGEKQLSSFNFIFFDFLQKTNRTFFK